MTGPLIAVPTYPRLQQGKVKGWADDGVGLPARYVDALHRAGGQEACFLPGAWDDDDAAALLRRVDGLLLVGGGDLAPATYGSPEGAACYGIAAARDACELALARAAATLGVPTLAICRGHQVLAVALGGTLDPDLGAHPSAVDHGTPGVAGGSRTHPVEVRPGSRLEGALGVPTAAVASHHHQAVVTVGPAVASVAHAPDSVIEAIELTDPDGPWIVGVQWHPEDTAARDPVQQRLFDRFVAQCAPRPAATPPG